MAARERLQVGVVFAGAARPPGGAERRQPRVLEWMRGELGEELLILWVGAGEAPLDVVEAEPIQRSRDARLVRRRKRHGGALGAIAQRRVVDHDSPCCAGGAVVGAWLGHKKTSGPCLAGRSHDISGKAKSGNLPE